MTGVLPVRASRINVLRSVAFMSDRGLQKIQDKLRIMHLLSNLNRIYVGSLERKMLSHQEKVRGTFLDRSLTAAGVQLPGGIAGIAGL
jgi:hypothetical protein